MIGTRKTKLWRQSDNYFLKIKKLILALLVVMTILWIIWETHRDRLNEKLSVKLISLSQGLFPSIQIDTIQQMRGRHNTWYLVLTQLAWYHIFFAHSEIGSTSLDDTSLDDTRGQVSHCLYQILYCTMFYGQHSWNSSERNWNGTKWIKNPPNERLKRGNVWNRLL